MMRARVGWPIAGAISGLFFGHWPMLSSGLGQIQYDIGDTRLINFIFEHSWRWLIGAPAHQQLFDAPFFYPARNVLAYSETLVGSAPLYWLFRLFGARWDTSFQLWLLAVSALNFVTFYLLLHRRLKLSEVAATFGALLFAFGSPRLNQLGHSQLVPQFYSVICIYALLAVASEQTAPAVRARWLAIAVFCLPLQVLTGFYAGWLFGLALAVALAWALVLPSRRAVIRALVAHPIAPLLAALAGAALLAPVGMAHLEAVREVGGRTWEQVSAGIPRIESWLDVGPRNWIWGTVRRDFFAQLPFEWEHRGGLGLLTPLAGLAGLWLERRRRFVQLLLLTLATCFALSLLWGEWTAWQYVFRFVPGAKAVGAVVRITLLSLIPIGVGVAFVVERLARVHPAVALAVGLAVMVEQGQSLPSFDKLSARKVVERVAAQVPPGCQAFLYSAVQPRDRDPVYYQIDAMLAVLEAGVPTLNGYSGNRPPDWPFSYLNAPVPLLQNAMTQWIAARGLDASRVCWVQLPDDGARPPPPTTP